MKQPTRYPKLFDGVLALEFTDDGDMLPPGREAIRRRVLAQLQPIMDRAHARAHTTGEAVGIGALNRLRTLLANPLDDAGLFEVGMLVQRVIYAAPMFDAVAAPTKRGRAGGKVKAEESERIRNILIGYQALGIVAKNMPEKLLAEHGIQRSISAVYAILKATN